LKPLGQHLLLDLFDCDAKAIGSLQIVKTSMLEAARRACATVVNTVFHEFSPYGVSGVVVIAESHLANSYMAGAPVRRRGHLHLR
jgi:S-adenosylmethionine/arginine decarboxylase-like enzyme